MMVLFVSCHWRKVKGEERERERDSILGRSKHWGILKEVRAPTGGSPVVGGIKWEKAAATGERRGAVQIG